MNRDDSQLVLRDIPIFLWLLGLIFAGVGFLIYFDGGKAPAMGLVFAAIGLGCLLFPGILTITADRIRRTLRLEYRSALRYKLKEVLFDEIAGIYVRRSASHNKGGRSSTYGMVIKNKDGKEIPFHSYSSSGSKRKERQARQLRDFIGIQASDNLYAGMPQTTISEVRETNGVHWQIEQVTRDGSSGARWHSPDFKTPGAFLLVAQKAEGQASQGFLASLGSMIFKRTLSAFGFKPDDTPGLDRASALAPLDPALEAHFMAFTNNHDLAHRMLDSGTIMPLAAWARRYPLKQFQKGSGSSQLVVLFGPNGVYLATLNLSQPAQVDELAALGADLVKSRLSSK